MGHLAVDPGAPTIRRALHGFWLFVPVLAPLGLTIYRLARTWMTGRPCERAGCRWRMLSLLLPRQFDNTFRGWRLGLWLFVPVLIVRLGIGFNSAFNARETAMNADGIPLNLLGEAGANEAVAIFALLGFAGVLLALLGVLALVRYRSMIPLMYLVFLLHQLGNRVLNSYHATLKGGAKTVGGGIPVASIVVYSLLGMLVIGFVLSLIPRGERT